MSDRRTIKGRPKVHDVERRGLIVRMPEELRRRLRLLSVARGTSMNQMLVDVLEGWLAEQPEHEKIRRLAAAGG